MADLSFEQLLEEKKFNIIKVGFLKGDEQFRDLRYNNEDIKVDLMQDDIIVFKEIVKTANTEIDDFGFSKYPDEIEVIERKLNFHKDWLIPKIGMFYNSYMGLVIQEIARIEPFGDIVVENYCKKMLNILNMYEDKVKNAEHLNDLVKESAVAVIQKLYKSINYDFYKRAVSVPNKIRLKLSKSQVCLFFQLLLNNKIITGSHPNDLFRFVENNFYYYNSSKKEYLEIEDAKVTSDNLIGKKSIKSANATLIKLKSIFGENSFYENTYE